MALATPVATPFPFGPPGVYSVQEIPHLLAGAQGPPGDAVLLGRIAAGDIDAFQAFYGRYAGRVLAYARQLSRHGDAAEDVTQEVFVAVWRRAASYRPERGDVTGWLY